MKLSQRASRIAQSEIRVMSVECERVKGVNLAQGICDTEVPEPVRRGAHEAIESGRNQYTRLDGIPELRRAIARKMQRYNGVVCDPESEIVVTTGSTGGFYGAALALLNPDDEVILFEPYYGYHLHTLEMIGCKPVFCALEPPDWKFSYEKLQRLITPKTRAIVVNTPGNPSGKVFDEAELSSIATLCIEHFSQNGPLRTTHPSTWQTMLIIRCLPDPGVRLRLESQLHRDGGHKALRHRARKIPVR